MTEEHYIGVFRDPAWFIDDKMGLVQLATNGVGRRYKLVVKDVSDGCKRCGESEGSLHHELEWLIPEQVPNPSFHKYLPPED